MQEITFLFIHSTAKLYNHAPLKAIGSKKRNLKLSEEAFEIQFFVRCIKYHVSTSHGKLLSYSDRNWLQMDSKKSRKFCTSLPSWMYTKLKTAKILALSRLFQQYPKPLFISSCVPFTPYLVQSLSEFIPIHRKGSWLKKHRAKAFGEWVWHSS